MRSLGVLIFVALLALPCHEARAADPCADGDLKPVSIANGETLKLNWIGTVTERMARKIDTAFEANKRRVKSVELSIQSCGGRTDYMADTIAVLQQIKTTHQLSTVVEPGATCASACIPIFLASDRRRAALSSVWFFHRSWRYQLSGGVDSIGTTAPGTRSVEGFLNRYYAPAGVSPAWLKQLQNVIENNGGYWQTGRDLWDAKSGIATETIGDVQPQPNRQIYLAPSPGCTAMCRG
jgi:ATP-dependent protease ClpP protease subunit